MFDFIWEFAKSEIQKAEPYVSYVMGWASFFNASEYNRLIELWYVYLKVDLDIPGSIKHTRTTLLAHLRNEAIFSSEFIAYFLSDPILPLDTDPAQITTIKRILCALNNLEQGCNNVLDTNVGPDRDLIGLHYELIPKLVSLASTLTQELYTLNQGSADVEILIGSYVKPLVSKLTAMLKTTDLKNVPMPSLNQTLQLFPESSINPHQGLGNLSELMFQLPVYFQELQSLMDPSSLKKLSSYDELTLKTKTETLLNNLKMLADGDGIALLPSGISTVQLLLEQLPTLLNSSGHFTKTSHSKLNQLLTILRHKHFPEIIAELEGVEEHFSLRPNVLVEPTLTAMKHFYSGLASLSDCLVATSGAIQDTTTHLNKPPARVVRGFFGDTTPVKSIKKPLKSSSNDHELCDDEFTRFVKHQRVLRWMHVDYAQQDMSVLDAANRFFENASACFDVSDNASIMMELYTGRMKEVPSETIQALKKDYKIIQPYYARLYPDLDILFVDNFPLWLERFNPRESPVQLIKQTMAQAAFTRNSIEVNSQARDQLYQPQEKPADFIHFLQTKKIRRERDEHAINMHKIKQNLINHSINAVGDQDEYIPPISRALSQKPSKQLSQFINNTLKTWLENNISPSLFNQLSFDTEKMIQSAILNNEIQAFNNTPSVLFYKKLLCSFAMIQSILVKLEDLHDNKASSTDLLIMLITNKEIWLNLYYATQFIMEAVSSPELGEIIKKGLWCLEPLKNIPVLGEYIQSIHAQSIPTMEENRDIIVRWKQQVELMKQTLAGSSEETEPRPLGSGNPVANACDTDLSGETNTDALTEINTLHNIAKQLYITPQLIRKFNPDPIASTELNDTELNAKASHLISVIKSAQFNLETLKKILANVNELNNALSQVGVEAKSAVIAIEHKLSLDLLSTADEIEFQLGFKPGVMTTPLDKALNGYFGTLMIDFPVSIDEKFELIKHVGLIDTRIDKEKARLIALPGEREKRLSKMKDDLLSGYQELRMLKKSMRESQSGYTQENRETALRVYQKLQPWLYKIKAIYDPVFFLRRLQNQHDFVIWFNEIQAMKGKVFLLIEQEKQDFADVDDRAHERITLLERRKKNQEQQAIKMKQAFKFDLFMSTAFHHADDVLNNKTQSKVAKHDNAIINLFNMVITLLPLSKKSASKNDSGNIIATFEITKKKWNAHCAAKIRANAKTTQTDIEQQINTEVEQLYVDYYHLIDAYKQLETMRNYIQQHPSASAAVDKEKIHWIDTLSAGLSNHTLSPKQRLLTLATIAMGKNCKTALEKNSDHFFIRLLHKLYKLVFKLDTPENIARMHLHKKFISYKTQQHHIKTKLPEKPASSAD